MAIVFMKCYSPLKGSLWTDYFWQGAQMAMKTTLAVIAALLLTTSTGRAGEVRSGFWTVFDSDGQGKFKPLCGMKTEYADVQASIMVKYILGSDNFTIHIFKQGWRFPTDQPVNFPITLGFDQEAWGQAKADGITQPSAGPMIEFYVPNKSISRFLKSFGDAQLLWIRFDEGSEKPWTAKMSGSRNAARLFGNCVVNLINANSTQPYGESSTQPYGKNSTQPYAAKPPTQPYGAPKEPLKLQPALKRDDGQI